MSLNIEHLKSGPTSPWVPSSNEVEVPKGNSASTASNALSRPNEELRNMPYPPGLDPHPTDGLPTKLAGNSVSRQLRHLRHKGNAVLSAIANQTR